MPLLGYAEMTRPVSPPTSRRRRNAVGDIFQGISPEELAILRSTESLRLNGNSDNCGTPNGYSDESLLEQLNESLMMSSATTPPRTTSANSILTSSTSPSTSPRMQRESSPMSTSPSESRLSSSICNSQRYRSRRNGLANIMDPQNTGSCHGR